MELGWVIGGRDMDDNNKIQRTGRRYVPQFFDTVEDILCCEKQNEKIGEAEVRADRLKED